MVAIAVVVLVGSLTDWQKERQFRVLSAKKDERAVTVVRAGVARRVGVHDVVVGDVERCLAGCMRRSRRKAASRG